MLVGTRSVLGGDVIKTHVDRSFCAHDVPLMCTPRTSDRRAYLDRIFHDLRQRATEPVKNLPFFAS